MSATSNTSIGHVGEGRLYGDLAEAVRVFGSATTQAMDAYALICKASQEYIPTTDRDQAEHDAFFGDLIARAYAIQSLVGDAYVETAAAAIERRRGFDARQRAEAEGTESAPTETSWLPVGVLNEDRLSQEVTDLKNANPGSSVEVEVASTRARLIAARILGSQDGITTNPDGPADGWRVVVAL
jgi:hypothetical protein